MADHVKVTKQIQADILALIQTRDIDLASFMDEVGLKTGLKESTIADILGKMNRLNYIRIVNDVVRKPTEKTSEEEKVNG
ncbi:hypothetical protein CMI37_25060 [Candidatus Pacearchaeota archaeon]|nr:hypothetical protein [Candidatus Pacearchaeota archaeon]|tara:strand:+ start:160 stop:399 length:240 start_codon:yes stop_codon:yes gene_type:complete